MAYDDCTKCGEETFSIKGLCTDRDGIREDRYCPSCNTRFGMRCSGMPILSEGVDNAKVTKENRKLKTTIKTMMELKITPKSFTREIINKIIIKKLEK